MALIVPSIDEKFAQRFFDSLPPEDVNRRYYEGQLQYESPATLLGKLLNVFSLCSKFETLQGFYPHHRAIEATKEEMDQ